MEITPVGVMTEAASMRRRVATIEISPAFLLHSCKGGRRCFEVIENPLPDDARIVGANYDAIRDVWLLGIESASFEEVPEYVQVPVLPSPVFRIIEEHNHE